jgi:hypothetical protein
MRPRISPIPFSPTWITPELLRVACLFTSAFTVRLFFSSWEGTWNEMSESTSQSDSARPSVWLAYRWPLALVALMLIPLAGYLASLRATKEVYDDSIERVGRVVEGAAKTAVELADKFQQGTITHTFIAAIPEMASTGMGNLELATSEATETFSRTDKRTVAWNWLNLGTTVSEIKVPVTYRYHLRLSDPWQLNVSGQTCIVVAPEIRPSLPPAIHTDKMEKKSERGWARFNEREQMEELERSITPELVRMAGDSRHMNLVREQCRKTVAEFVKNWLLREDHWRNDRFHAIKVIFADEVGIAPHSDRPTVEF